MVVSVDSNATSLAQKLAGAGITVSNATLTCTGHATGIFYAIPQTLPIGEGIVLTTGRATDVVPGGNPNFPNWPYGGDPDLDALDPFSFAGNYDACALEFDIFVSGDSVSFDYVFGSVEYNEWVGSQYNDQFAFFISGPGITGLQNLALVPGTLDRVRINTINCDSNSQYYICNTPSDPWNFPYGSVCAPGLCPSQQFPWLIAHDGHTTVLQAKAAVQPCETYHLKLVIQDNSDRWLDSGVFIRKASINSNTSIITAEVDYADQVFGDATAVEGCINGRFKIELVNPASSVTTITLGVGGTAQQGIDYDSIPLTVTFNPGETVQYIYINVIDDGMSDPNETVFLYQFSPCTGMPMDTTYLFITDLFVAQTIADTGICLGETVFLSVNGGAGISYAWSPSAGLTCDDCQFPFATPTQSTTYTVVISTASGCSASDEVVILINPDHAAAGDDGFICGYTTTLNGSDPLNTTALWTQHSASSGGTATFANANAQSTSVTVSSAGDYVFVYTVGDACQHTDTILITFAVPEVVIDPDTSSICPGNCVTLNAVTATPQIYTVSPNLPITNGDWAGVYSTIDLSGFCKDSLTLDNLVGVTVNIQHSSVSDIKIVLIAPDGSAVGLAYQYGGLFGQNYTNTTFSPTASASIGTTPAPFTGTFLPYGSFNSIIGSPLSGTWSLWVTDLWGSGAPEGSLLDWSLVFNTNTYAWNPDPTLSATNIANPEACPTSPTTYTLVVTNDCGCSDTATAFVNTAGGMQTTFNVTDAGCNQPTGSITVTPNGTPPYAYAWSNGSTDQTISNIAAGTYIVTVTDATGCAGIDSAAVNVSDGPQVNGLVENAACGASDGSISLTISGGSMPYVFDWSNNAQTQDLANVPAGSYSVTVTDNNQCSAAQSFIISSGDSIVITGTTTTADCNQSTGAIDITVSGGTAPYTYEWDNGSTDEDLNNVPAASYSVTVTDAAGCVGTASFTVANADGPVITLSATNPSCGGNDGSVEVTITGGAMPYTFEWHNGATTEDISGLSSGEFLLTVTDAANCSAAATGFLTADSSQTLVLSSLAGTACVGDSLTVTASGFTDYVWSPASGLSSSTGSSVVITAVESQTYTIVGSAGTGCVDTASFTLTVVPAAFVSFTDSFAGCAPLEVLLLADAQNASTVQWWIGGVLASTQNPASLTLDVGTYDAMVVAQSPGGCNDTVWSLGFANVFSSPDASFETSLADGGTTGSLYDFNNTSVGATHYHWLFGDGTADTVTNPQHTFINYGSYTVILTAINDEGCSDTAQAFIVIDVPHVVFIPNTFSPNGDGINDLFGIYGPGIRRYRLIVFDRWGERVFDDDGASPQWDGTFNGLSLNSSTFVYSAEVEFFDGQTVRYWGDINLLR